MVIKITPTNLLIEKDSLNAWEDENIESLMPECLEVSKSAQYIGISGTKEELFDYLLYLSFKVDIELT